MKAELVSEVFHPEEPQEERERESQIAGAIPSTEGTEVFLETLGTVRPGAVALGASIIIAWAIASPDFQIEPGDHTIRAWLVMLITSGDLSSVPKPE